MTVPAESKMGPALRALNERQRAFVCAMVELGGSNNTEAARRAGYMGDRRALAVTAHRLMHDEDVMAAIQEEASRQLRSGQLKAVAALQMIIDKGEKDSDRLKAIEMLMNRTGMHATSEHKVVNVNHSKTDAELIKRLRLLAKEAGLDASGLLYQIGYIEGEFVEINQNVPDRVPALAPPDGSDPEGEW
jgi:phage terminase small subunit